MLLSRAYDLVKNPSRASRTTSFYFRQQRSKERAMCAREFIQSNHRGRAGPIALAVALLPLQLPHKRRHLTGSTRSSAIFSNSRASCSGSSVSSVLHASSCVSHSLRRRKFVRKHYGRCLRQANLRAASLSRRHHHRNRRRNPRRTSSLCYANAVRLLTSFCHRNRRPLPASARCWSSNLVYGNSR